MITLKRIPTDSTLNGNYAFLDVFGALRNRTRHFGVRLMIGLFIAFLVAFGVWVLAVALPWKTGESQSWIFTFSQTLHDSWVGTGIRESIYLFPLIEGVHLLGIALSVGTLCWFDLRLLGIVLREEPVSKVWKQVMPLALIGFILMFATGVLLF